ncbi:hypothetical protein DFJ73DRAFT_825552 [Zopfochytrium polystomum]|nr:hypothetical protein DFJ73DRAFT_825552 [Zopfochytrium polystomum]
MAPSHAAAPSTSSSLRPAATLLVCAPRSSRSLPVPGDRADFRILMLKRNAAGTFKSVHVFPGGVVEASDGELAPKSHPLGAHAIAAIRETFEECGVGVFDPPVALDEKSSLDWRKKVHDDATQFKRFCAAYKVEPAVGRLVHWAHWVTPKFEKKRFDTQFFLSVLDSGEAAASSSVSVDGTENVLMDWLSPSEALQAFREKRISLMPPQFVLLTHLQNFTLKDLRGFVASQKAPVDLQPYEPVPQASDEGLILALPGDVLSRTPQPSFLHRVVMSMNGDGSRELKYIKTHQGKL